jgi:hypothetical protein
MVCIYTAQGEFVCKEVEKFQEEEDNEDTSSSFGVVENPYTNQTMEQYVNCYGIEGESCNTCYDVKRVHDNAGKKFNPKTIDQCRNPDPKGEWKKNCRWGTVRQDGVYTPQCKIDNKWPRNGNENRSEINLYNCVSGKLYYNPTNGSASCQN